MAFVTKSSNPRVTLSGPLKLSCWTLDRQTLNMLDFDIFADVSGQMLITRKIEKQNYIWYSRYLIKFIFLNCVFSQKVLLGKTRGKVLFHRAPLPPCGTMGLVKRKFHPFSELWRLLNWEVFELDLVARTVLLKIRACKKMTAQLSAWRKRIWEILLLDHFGFYFRSKLQHIKMSVPYLIIRHPG